MNQPNRIRNDTIREAMMQAYMKEQEDFDLTDLPPAPPDFKKRLEKLFIKNLDRPTDRRLRWKQIASIALIAVMLMMLTSMAMIEPLRTPAAKISFVNDVDFSYFLIRAAQQDTPSYIDTLLSPQNIPNRYHYFYQNAYFHSRIVTTQWTSPNSGPYTPDDCIILRQSIYPYNDHIPLVAAEATPVRINGYAGWLFQRNNRYFLIWGDTSYAFSLYVRDSQMTAQDVLAIARSVQ